MNVSQLSAQIVQEFKDSLNDVKLTTDEEAMVKRAGDALAAAAVSSLDSSGQPDPTLKTEALLATATLANLAVFKAIQVEQLVRQSAYNALVKVVGFALDAVLAAA